MIAGNNDNVYFSISMIYHSCSCTLATINQDIIFRRERDNLTRQLQLE